MSGRIGQGDLVVGGVAAAGLPLLVFGLDLSVWVAIPLAVATYTGGVLLHPRSSQPDDLATDGDRATPKEQVATGPAAEPEVAPLSVGHRAADVALGLTPRETEVLRLMANGDTNQEIADTLFISRRTVTTHVANIFGKLDVASRAEAVAFAHRHGLADDEPVPPPRSTPPSAGGLRTGT